MNKCVAVESIRPSDTVRILIVPERDFITSSFASTKSSWGPYRLALSPSLPKAAARFRRLRW